MRQSQGFTLIELMIVVAIIGVMASMALPTYQDFVIRGQISEALQLSSGVKRHVAEYYARYQRFPADNPSAGVPAPQQLIGNYVSGVTVEDGAIHITLGHRINAHAEGKVLSLRPAVVSGSPDSPISWLCGYAQAVPGMQAVGENRTDVPAPYLGLDCRTW